MSQSIERRDAAIDVKQPAPGPMAQFAELDAHNWFSPDWGLGSTRADYLMPARKASSHRPLIKIFLLLRGKISPCRRHYAMKWARPESLASTCFAEPWNSLIGPALVLTGRATLTGVRRGGDGANG
jgi:hypothetical protein